MKRSSRSTALLSLLLTAGFGLGLEVDHGERHGLGSEHEDALRFVAGHERPISEEHVEGAASLGEDSCLACALRTPSHQLDLRPLSKTRLPRLAGSAFRERAHRPLQAAFSLRFGRAPPSV